jgi:hypothetical protein
MIFASYVGDDVKGRFVQIFVRVQEAPRELEVVVLLFGHLIATSGEEYLKRFAIEAEYHAVNRDVRVEIQSILVHVVRWIGIR